MSRESYKNVVREEASQQSFDINNVEVREGEDCSCKPALLVITNVIDAETKSELLIALEQIKFTQLDLKVINLSGKSKGLAFFLKKLFCMKQFMISHHFEHYHFVFVPVTRYYAGYPVLVFVPVGEPHFNKSA